MLPGDFMFLDALTDCSCPPSTTALNFCAVCLREELACWNRNFSHCSQCQTEAWTSLHFVPKLYLWTSLLQIQTATVDEVEIGPRAARDTVQELAVGFPAKSEEAPR